LFLFLTLAFSSGGVVSSVGQELKNQERISPQLEKTASREELINLKVNLKQAHVRQLKLTDEIKLLDKDRAAINRALIATANRFQELEGEISDEEQRLSTLQTSQFNIRKSLLSKREILAEILAALQRMGRNPPPAILVRPEDALTSVRSAILLGAVVPEIRSETKTLLSELRTLSEIGLKIADKKKSLSKSLNSLAEDENRLSLLIDEKNSLAKLSRKQLAEQKKKTELLASKATSLEELIGKMEAQIASAAAAARAARLADRKRKVAEETRLAKAKDQIASGNVKFNTLRDDAKLLLDPRFSDNNRSEPAVAFKDALGLLPLPVSGLITHVFGKKSSLGRTHKNVGFKTRPNARVRSPADGWISYAGTFRSYGQLVIINVGDGYSVILSGMSDINVATGQFVLAGEPIARMGQVQIASTSTTELPSGQPVLYVEFRKNKSSIDPSPWWADQKRKRSKDDS